MKIEKARKFFMDFDKQMKYDEALFALYDKENEKESAVVVVVPSTAELQAQVAATLTERICLGLMGEGDKNDKLLADMLTFAVDKAREMQVEFEMQEEDEEDEDEIEDCADCPDMRTCDQKQAIAYRKKHHIPKPKKKSNKK